MTQWRTSDDVRLEEPSDRELDADTNATQWTTPSDVLRIAAGLPRRTFSELELEPLSEPQLDVLGAHRRGECEYDCALCEEEDDRQWRDPR